jgi:hypothetical protein
MWLTKQYEQVLSQASGFMTAGGLGLLPRGGLGRAQWFDVGLVITWGSGLLRIY